MTAIGSVLKLFAGLFAKSKQTRRRRSMRWLKEIIRTLVRGVKFYLNLSNCACSLYFE